MFVITNLLSEHKAFFYQTTNNIANKCIELCARLIFNEKNEHGLYYVLPFCIYTLWTCTSSIIDGSEAVMSTLWNVSSNIQYHGMQPEESQKCKAGSLHVDLHSYRIERYIAEVSLWIQARSTNHNSLA
jgi:hypothetical protein